MRKQIFKLPTVCLDEPSGRHFVVLEGALE